LTYDLQVRREIDLSACIFSCSICLRCSCLGGDTRNGITVSPEEVIPLDGSRGEANFVIKWPKASDQSYIKFLTNHKAVKKSYTAEDSGKFVTILGFECRGIEPVAWHPSVDFNIESTGGCIFDKADLTEKEWADYDEDNDLSVSIMSLEYKFESTP
jgi:hypothetical protein